MSANQQTPVSQSRAEDAPGLARSLLDALGSVRFAVSVVVLIAIACVIGTLLPQGAQVADFLRNNPEAAGWIRIAEWAGLTHVFSSAWFLLLLGVFAASLARCGTRRLQIVRRTDGPARWRAFGSFLTHLSLLLLFVGGSVRAIWGERGLMELREGQSVSRIQLEDASVDLPFSIHLDDFTVETYATKTPAPTEDAIAVGPAPTSPGHLYVEWTERSLTAELPVELHKERVLVPPGESPGSANSWRIRVDQYVPDFVADKTTGVVSSRSDNPVNPAILVAVTGPGYANHRWVFARFPDQTLHTAASPDHAVSPLRILFHAASSTPAAAVAQGPVKSFRSAIRVIEQGQVVHQQTIAVNHPFSYRGYTFYQLGYNPQDPAWTSLQVVRDPGVPAIYLGFVLMVAGLFIVFYVNPWLVLRRVEA